MHNRVISGIIVPFRVISPFWGYYPNSVHLRYIAVYRDYSTIIGTIVYCSTNIYGLCLSTRYFRLLNVKTRKWGFIRLERLFREYHEYKG